MEEQLQLATLEQAKKLKQLGFDYMCGDYYQENDGKVVLKNLGGAKSNESNKIGAVNLTFTPTVALALRWLRDEKKVYVESPMIPTKSNGDRFDSVVKIGDAVHCDTVKDFESHEKADSVGLDYAIDYLLKQE